MSDLISVIIPVYNASQYLDQCIRSIQAQTYKNLEIILIDDGSTDSSACICEKYQKTDGRVLFLQQKNFGSVIARKTGLKKANVTINRKMLAEIAVSDEKAFAEIVAVAKKA